MIRVAVFNGTGAGSETRLIQGKMYEWMGCDVTYVDNQDIIDGKLSQFDLLGFPGGDYVAYWRLGQEGKARIQEFVRDGGAYLGICAGAWYASDYMVWKADGNYPPPDYKVEGDELNLDLFPGVAVGPIEEITPPYTGKMTRISFVNRDHPITDSLPEGYTVLYWGGPDLVPYEGADVTVLATFEETGTPAIVAFEYGKGRVFLMSPHAEVEVESDRDGIPLDNPLKDFDDPESNWPLFVEAVRWLTMRSTESRMQELTDSFRSSEIKGLNATVQLQGEALGRGLNETSTSLAALKGENSELEARLDGLEELSSQLRTLYIITGASLAASVSAILLHLWRKRW